jgi:hypothetical protein
MTQLFQRLTKRHISVLVILTALTLVSSISLAIGWRLSGNGIQIAMTGSAHAASIGMATQAPDPFAPCVPAAANAIACENSKPGNPESEWDINEAGDANIQGFATNISVNRGETVRFKINTNSNNYRLDIYRLGYYGGLGARLITTVQPSASLPQSQPSCLTQASTGLIDCGNWAESANWAVPSNATSGIYIAKLVREDGSAGVSHIVFIVRDDNGASDLLFQTSDTTWQAYNSFGGNSLYQGSPDGRAYKVSYNRPFNTRAGVTSQDWLFDGEYPMVRWLEANGYNVSYFTGIDTDRRGAELLEHDVFLSVGHDEYWSGTQRANVEAARNAGVHLAFFSGNTMFWKTRWENSIDGSGTQFRTLVCYKETHANAKIDPLPNVWTGTWRDPRFSPPADGGRPENALIGTIFTVNDPAFDEIEVPEALGKFRFWRNTTVATQPPGQTATVGPGTVGYEWDEDLNNGSRPSGLIRLSTNTVNVSSYLQDHGSTYAPGTATHNLTLYRHGSGALVFSAATIRWSWGLDNNHDQGGAPTIPPPDARMRQATVNLLADMGVQPATLQPGLVAATPSTDTQPPVSTITSPAAGANVQIGTAINITGTASDAGGGLVAGVNVSVNGGVNWPAATGTNAWSFNWTPTALGPVTIRSRAVDDSGNPQNTPTEITVTVVASQPPQCPCNIWASGATPANPIENDGGAVELGLKFRSDINGFISGVRFYKGGAANGGAHVGHLWTSSGTLLGTVNFINETASGWQQALFQNPIAITANTTYVVSYFAPQGHYAADSNYFASSGVDNGSLHALSNALAGGNGVYHYSPTGGFPADTFQATNYWVDVVFTTTTSGPDTTPPTVSSFAPAAGANNVSVGANVVVTFSEAMNATTVNGTTVELRNPSNTLVPATVSYNAASLTATLDPTAALAAGTTYTARVRGGATDPRVKDLAGNALAADVTWTFTTAAPITCPCSIWASGATPANPLENDGGAVELGLKFRSDIDGFISGVRFYKGGAANGGAHVGHLWSSAGALLGSVNFTNETASGWQQALFQNPIQITANTTYVVSYFAPQGHYAADANHFASSGVDNAPLHALSNALAGGNGVYHYSPTGGFPADTFQATNYWVDVVFATTTSGPDTTPPTVSSFAPAAGANNVNVGANVVVTFSEAMNATTVNGTTIELRNPSNTLVPATVSYDAASLTATLDPTAALAAGTTYTARVRGGATDPRVKDLAGNALAADVTWTFTTAAPITCPCNIWASGVTPANPIENDGSAVELGLKFRSDTDGVITGVRFYKGGAANGGAHVGHLWNSAGALLGSVNFTNETASGWQQALFQNPIPITANTTYVVSYFAPQGNYAADANYFASSGVDNGPLHALSNALAGGNGVFHYGPTGGFPTNTNQAGNYWVDVVFNQSGPLPPQVLSVTPASGATGVSTGVAPAATFSEPLNSASLTTSTVLLRDAANNSVPVTISYDSSIFTVTLAPTQSLQPGQTYTVTLKGGATAPRITDATGTALASDFVWSFTTQPLPPPITAFSIWASTATPTSPLENDGAAVELGLKFRSDIDGIITGVRFYKGGAANGGAHVGHLWTSSGTLLGTVNFTNETASGWQQALFQNPIPITANTTYVVSYFAPQGHYAADTNYFASSGVDNAPLHALSNALAAGNGVFQYGQTGGFPTDTFQAANYWVDVLFIDPAPPEVVTVTPAAGATGVSTNVAPTATFSEPLNSASLTASTVLLRDAANNPVPFNISYSSSTFTVTLTPQQELQLGQTYTVTLKGGATAPQITDATGTPLASDFVWSFTTQALPPPLPILLITRSGNKFTQYYQEILRAEGFNNFNVLDMTQVTDAVLAEYDVAILGEMPLTSTQVTRLSNWVGSGGNLIAMRPDKQLASLLGINDAASVRSDAYLLVNTAQQPGSGIVNQTIQYHSAADLYTLAGATQVATIYSSPTQATSNPAVTLRSVGTNGGQAAAFTFDLARSIVFTRQGNPAWAGQERDGFTPIRTNDLFFPDYVNLDKVAIPQADELQRLLGNMIISMNMDKSPLPRFWYFPNMKKAVILMTGDDHGTPEGTKSTFDLLIAESAPGCSNANWECYRATAWLYTASGLTNTQALSYHNQGFEMGVHVNTNCANWTPQTLNSFFANDLASFAAKYTSIPAQKTNRTHCIPWSDWATHPKVELNNGIRLDKNYYYWPASWVQNRPGFMTGSGIPMRYADLDGSIIDVYQAATHLVNENGVTYPAGINSMLDKALGPEGYYGVFGTHYDYSDAFDTQLLNSAKARNVSLISAQQLLTWLDGRNSSSFGNPTWNGAQLAFSITVGLGANNLFAMIPNQTPGGQLSSLTINGSPVSFTVQTIKGRSYAVFRAANGNAVATYAP